LDESQVVARGLLISGGHGSKALECVKEALHDVALSEKSAGKSMLLPSFGSGMDDWLHSLVAHRLNECVRIVTAIADQCLASRMLEKLRGDDHLMPLTFRDRDVDRSPFRIDDGVDLR
jgi:hypothetical protein